jgi:hypothetical protein
MDPIPLVFKRSQSGKQHPPHQARVREQITWVREETSILSTLKKENNVTKDTLEYFSAALKLDKRLCFAIEAIASIIPEGYILLCHVPTTIVLEAIKDPLFKDLSLGAIVGYFRLVNRTSSIYHIVKISNTLNRSLRNRCIFHIFHIDSTYTLDQAPLWISYISEKASSLRTTLQGKLETARIDNLADIIRGKLLTKKNDKCLVLRRNSSWSIQDWNVQPSMKSQSIPKLVNYDILLELVYYVESTREKLYPVLESCSLAIGLEKIVMITMRQNRSEIELVLSAIAKTDLNTGIRRTIKQLNYSIDNTVASLELINTYTYSLLYVCNGQEMTRIEPILDREKSRKRIDELFTVMEKNKFQTGALTILYSWEGRMKYCD